MSNFADNLRNAVNTANKQLRGSEPTPWNVLMEYVIFLENRVETLERSIYGHSGSTNNEN